MLSFLLFLLTCIIIAVFVDYLLVQRAAEQQCKAATLDTAAQLGADGAAPSWRSLLPHPKPPVEGERFRAWAVQALADQPELQAWLQSLPASAMQVLTAHVADFCADMEIALTWLLDQQLEGYPAVAQALTRMISLYAQACHTGVLVQNEVVAMKAYHKFMQNPYGKANQPFAQALFAQLLEQQITPAIRAEFAQAPELERQVYIVQAIRQAAEKEPKRFHQARLAAVRTPAAAALEAESAPPANGKSGFSLYDLARLPAEWLRGKPAPVQPAASKETTSTTVTA